MNVFLRIISLLVVLTTSATASFAQYYSWGADRASLKWSTIERDSVKVLYPNIAGDNARRTMHFIEAAKPDINFSFEQPPLKIPFVMHVDNFATNGLVMWMPKRVEFLSTPSVDGYSMPWVKQLVAHEYRHAVQYNNLNQSTIKVVGRLLGQQGSALSLLYIPLYALEGDAVMMETQMSTYGRGLQPSFTIGYRALADELLDKSKYMKWRCGSYVSNIPDHYQMGYQMMSYAYEKYDENILQKSFEYTARNPQFLAPYIISLRKFYDTSNKELFYDTFESLVSFWSEASDVENSADILTPEVKDNFVTYSHPQKVDDDKLLVLKSDYRATSRFVLFDPATRSEKKIAHTGSVSTRPAYADGRVWWTEYRRSPLFAQDVNSQLCYMDLEARRPKKLKGFKDALFPTPIGESKDHIAYVEYDPSGRYSVVELKGEEKIATYAIPFPNEVHSMAWDKATQRLYIIVTGEGGMWIEQQADNGFDPITKPAYITISNLTARDGVLYFGSIASGKDEVHSLDLVNGVQRQISESRYGSFQGSVVGNDVYMTTYDKYGYHLARQSVDNVIREVKYSNIPENQVNPERKKWDVVNLDTIPFDSLALAESEEKHKCKRYSKAAHLLDIHSWAPMRFDPLNIMSEKGLNLGLGATLVSQNLLSTCDGFLSYGWDRYSGSVLRTGINYNGLGVKLGLSATYGGTQNVYLVGNYGGELKRYADVTLSATLPLYFSRGYHNRTLTPYLGWGYSNGIMPTGNLEYKFEFNPQTEALQGVLHYDSWRHGLNKLSMGVTYSSYVQAAYRDLATPLGYTVSASYANEPLNPEFSQLVSLYSKVYTPGLAENNSFTVAAAYQNAFGGLKIFGYYPLSYMSTVLLPRGFTYSDVTNNSYFAASADYKFPLCYPEVGVWDMLYFKRLTLGLGADYARFKTLHYHKNMLYSYGVDLGIDLNLISLSPASTVGVTLSLYKPKNRSLYFNFGLDLPF